MILTIGIPVYNAEKFISRCLDSVMKLEDIDKYEVICVDDGSTDSTLDRVIVFILLLLYFVLLFRMLKESFWN